MTDAAPPADVHAALGEVYRRESGRCLATLVRVLGDLDLAEDAVAEAFAIAARRWPETGIPPNPGGWITTTARNRAIDRLRREADREARHRAAHHLYHDAGAPTDAPADLGDLDVVPDDQLRLIFLCCHPALAPATQVALTLRLVAGLETPEIARGFLVPEATLAQRLVRAKRKIRDNHIAYRIPAPHELPARLSPVLAVIYLVFNEGHVATSGDALVRGDLAIEAVRLARLLADLLPDEPEVLGLLALLLLTDARRAARTTADGALVPLAEQDRTRWDRARIAEGHALVRALLRRNAPGPYQIQAAIAAVHADARDAARTDWGQIVALYDQLLAHTPTPVVALNRAIALAERDGAAAGLAALEAVDGLDDYHLFHAARAELLRRAGRSSDARAAYERAWARTTNAAERRHLEQRRDTLAP